MPAVVENLGLCSTCNNAPGCYYRARRGPALFCEMFDDYVPPAARMISQQASPRADSSTAHPVAKEEVSKHSGLCMNCEHRWTCTYPKPEGGIWHCEDYE